MKNTILLFLGIFMLAGFSACKKEVVSPSPNRAFIYSVDPSQWKSELNGRVRSHTISINELTPYYVDQGGVSVAISFEDGSYDPLPTTYDGIAYYVNYYDGGVRIDYQSADAADIPMDPPGDVILVKIILSDTDYIQ